MAHGATPTLTFNLVADPRDWIFSDVDRLFSAVLRANCFFVTMIANPEFDLERHDPQDSKRKFGYYFSQAEPGNGGLLSFHPGGFEKERELTFELRAGSVAFSRRSRAASVSAPNGVTPSLARKASRSTEPTSSQTTSPTRRASCCGLTRA